MATRHMELKTNEDGKSVIDVLPMGSTMRMQIIAKGYQTYGQDYKIDKSDLAFGIRLKRPGEQYSIYKSHDEDAALCSDDKNGDSSTRKDAPARRRGTTRSYRQARFPPVHTNPSIQTAVVRLP